MRNIRRSVMFLVVFGLAITALSAVAQDELATAPANTPLLFTPVPPCRIVDTRNPNGTFGGPPIQGGTYRSFPIPQGNCKVPLGAWAYSLNVTVVPMGPLSYLTIWPTGQQQPVVSTMNSVDGRVKANAAIVLSGTGGAAVSVYASNTTNVVLDINGFFRPSDGTNLTFYPLPPCRVADTRNPNGPLGGPFLQGGKERDFPMLQATACNIPSIAVQYSLNLTAIPHGPLAYLTAWPAGQGQPTVSTLNAPTGTTTANAAMVGRGAGGDIAVYPTNDTDFIIDINGYFAAAGSPNSLSMYGVTPCRVLDTRQGNGAFSGELTVNVVGSTCAPPASAQAYILNATVIPQASLSYLTLWADGGIQPLVSTLNAPDGIITSNMAIVPTTNGLIDAYASNTTQLLLDISGYFAP